MASTKPVGGPGSPEFTGRLLSALEDDPRVRSLGPVELTSVEKVSRNTIIYRCTAGSTRLVAKAQLTKPGAVVSAEFDMLRDMGRRLGGSPVRSLNPIALFPELGVLLTEEEGGTSLREILEVACRDPRGGWERAESALRASAEALRAFHDAYEADDAHRTSDVRRYLDFSPKNLLIQDQQRNPSRGRVVLMDPPEEEVWGKRTEDIGGFCFDVTRIGFLPRFLLRWPVRRRIDRLKAQFISDYYGELGNQRTAVLEAVKEAEGRRAMQALRWYSRPWRYPSVVKETARLCYLGPLTAAYRFGGIHRSHSGIRRLLASVRSQEIAP